MKPFKLIVTTLVAALLCAPNAKAESKQVHPLTIGASAPDFDLPGVDGKKYTLKNFADAKILAVVLTCNHCPTAQAYEQRLFDLQRDYSGKGVAIVAISPNDPHALRLDELGYSEYGDSFEEMKLRASERKFPFPYLYDGDTQTVATAYGCLATPHIFIFDSDRKLRYQGRTQRTRRAARGQAGAGGNDARPRLLDEVDSET
jgi:peroxiredoxin